MEKIKLNHRFEELKALVLIPTYNNAPKLRGVLDSVLELTSHILVVNDGCTDETSQILEDYKDISTLQYEKNQGKGIALKKGLDWAVENGYQYAISMDSDGQHLAQDLEKFLDKIQQEPESMIIGARNMETADGVPGGSSFGHKFSNFWFHLETGTKLPDTQSGFRLYPLEQLKNLKFYTTKYEFEIESIVRLSWRGVKMLWVPITVEYPDDRITHFRKFWDFFRISLLNTVLVLIALLWIKPRDLYRRIVKGELKQIVMDEVLKTKDSNAKIAQSIGFGVFMGIFPVWGFQMLIAVAIAIPLKLNKAITLIAANISIPPMIPFILYFSFLTGALLLGGSAIPELSADLSLEDIKDDLLKYYLGAVVFSVFAGLVAGFSSWLMLQKWRKESIKK
jgi:glycosyltransferase involved in cell wall biosynthesis